MGCILANSSDISCLNQYCIHKKMIIKKCYQVLFIMFTRTLLQILFVLMSRKNCIATEHLDNRFFSIISASKYTIDHDYISSETMSFQILNTNNYNTMFLPISNQKAELIVLNKITAKSSVHIFNMGEVKIFGNLAIGVYQCIKSKNIFNKYNMMFIQVFENTIENENVLVFNGWLVSSNLSISTLEHPVYEVIAINCLSSSSD